MSSLFFALVEIGTLIIFIFTIAGLFGQFNWVADLTNHPRPFLLAGGIVAAILTAFSNQRVIFYFTISTVLINGFFVLPYLIPQIRPAHAANQTVVKLMTANVLYGNRNPNMMYDAVNQVDPDILIVQEMSGYNQDKMVALWEAFPYVSHRPNGGTQEIIVFSKIPLHSIDHFTEDTLWRSQAQITVNIDDQLTTIVGMHPKAPMSKNRYLRRNEELTRTAERVAQIETPLIVTGDLNITPWTPIFKRFLGNANLSDSRVRNGLKMTWAPDNLPRVIPIDHFLYRDIQVHSFATGPDTGSDHLPVVVEFSVK
ncbi:MAG: endonuclease/exonuclease/phosphatase family protein [Chloroflexota bacterium]